MEIIDGERRPPEADISGFYTTPGWEEPDFSDPE